MAEIERSVGHLDKEHRDRSIMEGEALSNQPIEHVVEFASNVLHFGLLNRPREEIELVAEQVVAMLGRSAGTSMRVTSVQQY